MDRVYLMLVDFAFENFKSYKNSANLSMEAHKFAEHFESLIKGQGGQSLLPVAVIYGPNGGGKSSVLQALENLCRLVTWPWMLMRMRSGRFLTAGYKPYAYDQESANSPTVFSVVFETDNYKYWYGLSTLKDQVLREYLYRKKPGKGAKAVLFERSEDGVALGSSLRRKGVSVKVDSMMPFLSFVAVNYDIDSVDDAFNWFLSCSFLDYSRARIENYKLALDNADLQREVTRMLNGMDIDIADIQFKTDEGGGESLYLVHKAGGSVPLEINEESNGTKKLLSLIPSILSALKTGSLIVSDELDAKLHPKLLKYIIQLFTDPDVNPNGAQLIFTSHDMSTLNSATFRRDEIWFAAKNEKGVSQLFSLADIDDASGKRVRTKNAYDRQYLAGEYGADPYLHSMLEWQ